MIGPVAGNDVLSPDSFIKCVDDFLCPHTLLATIGQFEEISCDLAF